MNSARLMTDIVGKRHCHQEIELKIDFSDKEDNELRELDQQLQGAYNKIDEIQNLIDKIFIDGNNTSGDATDTGT